MPSHAPILPDPPPGFTPYPRSSAFLELIGPVFQAGDGTDFRVGMRVDHRHVNLQGACHGGLLSTIADSYMTRFATIARFGADALVREHPPTVVTMHLGIDYLGPVRKGQWIEISARADRVGHKTVYVGGLMVCEGEPVLRATGIFQARLPR